MPSVVRTLTTLIAALVAILGLGASAEAAAAPTPATAIAFIYDSPDLPSVLAGSRLERSPPTWAYDHASMLVGDDPSRGISTRWDAARGYAYTAGSFSTTSSVAATRPAERGYLGQVLDPSGDIRLDVMPSQVVQPGDGCCLADC